MGTPMAFTSGTANGFSLGATKRATTALNPAPTLVAGNNWFNGVDVSETQYLIYSDIFSQGQSTIPNSKPTAWTTPDLSDASLLALINTLPDRVGEIPYSDINVALQWLQNSEKYFLIKKGYEDIVTDGLVLNVDAGWYNSYSGSGTVWTDLSGEGNNGTLFNSPSFSSNGLGSLNFDGTDDYVETTNTNSLGNFTAEVWFYPTAVQNNSASIISTQYPGTNGTVNYTMNWEGGIFIAGFYNGGWYQFTIQTPVLNRWNHYVLTYNGSIMIAYSGDSKPIGELVTSAIAAGGGPTRIGRRWDLNDIFLGQIAIARVYNRALSTTEILQNYDAQKSRFGFGGQSLFSGVTQYFDFSKQSSYSGSGSIMSDVSGNNHNGTVSGGNFLTIDGVPAYNCTGNGRVVTDNEFTYGNNYTIFAWARIMADSETSTWRTLFRTQDDDHPLIVADGSGLLGYFDNNLLNFVSYGLSVSTLGLENRWVLYTLVGNNGTSQTLYINDGSTNATVNVNVTGENQDAWGSTSGGEQPFGYISKAIVYNNQDFTQSQVNQYFQSTKEYYGYALNNTISYGLVMSLDAANPISYPGSGVSWYDLSPFGNTATLTNGPIYSTIGGGSISFDGTDDYAVDAVSSSTNISDFLTAEVWVYYEAGDGRILQKDDWGSNIYTRCWEIGGYAGVFRIEMWHSDGSGTLGYGNALAVNGWTYLAMTFDGTNIRLYQNSVLVTTINFPGDIRTDINTPITLGGRWSTSEYLNGNIGVARIYNRALSASEISINFDAQKSRFGL